MHVWLRCRAIIAALALCLLSAGASAQNGPPPRPSGGVNIHQVPIAFVGSGAMVVHLGA
jgi:hypothetical protein